VDELDADEIRSRVTRLRLAYDEASLELGDPESLADLGTQLLNLESLLRTDPVPGGRERDPRPLRSLVLEILDTAGVPLYSSQLAELLLALYAVDVAPERFGTLAADERRSYEQASERHGSRPPRRRVWLCHTVSEVDGQFVGVRRCWAAGDWPLRERVVLAPDDLNLLCRQVARFSDLALQLGLTSSAGRAWARQAMETPIVESAKPSELAELGMAEAVARAGSAARGRIPSTEPAARRSLAARLQNAPQFVQLFGEQAAPSR
jgi:hypothetical protein